MAEVKSDKVWKKRMVSAFKMKERIYRAYNEMKIDFVQTQKKNRFANENASEISEIYLKMNKNFLKNIKVYCGKIETNTYTHTHTTKDPFENLCKQFSAK